MFKDIRIVKPFQSVRNTVFLAYGRKLFWEEGAHCPQGRCRVPGIPDRSGQKLLSGQTTKNLTLIKAYSEIFYRGWGGVSSKFLLNKI